MPRSRNTHASKGGSARSPDTAKTCVTESRDGRIIAGPIVKRRWPTGFLESFGHDTEGFEAPARHAPHADRERTLDTPFDDA